jgi:hypothetical protein
MLVSRWSQPSNSLPARVSGSRTRIFVGI